jgi:zinc protease
VCYPGAVQLRPSRFARVAFFLAISLSSVSAAAAPAPPTLKAEKLTLPNGLEVILDEDHRTPIVTVNLWYHVGSKDEAERRSGFAHLFEHMMFQGSKHVPEDTFFKQLEKIGATGINGSTTIDRTNYHETVPANQLELALWLESDRMGFLLDHAGEETFKSQRDVVKNERRQRHENAPYGLVREFILAETFPKDHPYHLPTSGSMTDLDAASIGDVHAFFRKYYVPNNATLALSGDFDKKKATALIEKYFGPIPRGADVPRKAPAPVAPHGETVMQIDANVELPRVYLTWVTPPSFAAGDAELELAGRVLAGGKTSRLHKRLVHDLQIAQSVSAGQHSSELASEFSVVATAKPGHSAEELLRVIDEELGKLRQEGVNDAELTRVKSSITARTVFGIERSGSRADQLNYYNHYTGDPSFLTKDLARTVSATPEAVTQAARTYLKPKERVIAFVNVKKDAPAQGKVVNVKHESAEPAPAPIKAEKVAPTKGKKAKKGGAK